ncbi:MAG: carbohydrate ABC transporter permease [Clostridia bacterium]|nr:carbohydrate ABC transporter permease [Clostridia bacterium]
MKRKTRIANAFIYLFLCIIAFLVIMPLLYTIFASFKTNMELMSHPESLLPINPTLDNYKIAFSSEDFNVPRMLWYSVWYSLITTISVVLTSAMAAYSFERGNFPGKKLFFTIFCGLLFISIGGITIYPMFEITSALGLSDSLWGLAVVKIFSVGTTNLILVKGYVASLPRALDEAAEIDGCNFIQTFFKIILPLLKPILATVAVLSFNGSWNEYIMPAIFTVNRPEQRTLIAGVIALKNSDAGASNWGLMLAGSAIAFIPVLIAYLFGNRFFISGLTSGSVKE